MNGVPISTLKPIQPRKYLSHRSFTKKFGSTALVNLPSTLGVARMVCPDQEYTDFCTAYGEAVSNGYKYKVPMSAEWQVAAESDYLGFPIVNGADAVGSMYATMVYKTLPKALAPSDFTLDGKGADFIAKWGNWPSSLSSLTSKYLPGIPYKVDGAYDIFDNVRSALYQGWQTDGSVVKAFGNWYASWNMQSYNPSLKGHVSTPTDLPITLHRYTFVDWITDQSGVPYLVAAMTQGTNFGDGGFLYFNRETVNFAFKDMASDGLGLYITKPSGFDVATTIAVIRTIISYLTSRLANLSHA